MAWASQQLWLGLILLGLLIGLLSGRGRPAVLFFAASLLTYLTGQVSLSHWLSGFTHSALITLLLLIAVSIALEKTIYFTRLSRTLAKDNLSITLTRLGLSAALLSSITNNTAVVASLMTPVLRNSRHAPARLLLPLSYAAILGGTLTLIGTSTNLLINGFVTDSGLAPLGFFEFSIIGVVVTTACLLLLILTAPYLPDRAHAAQQHHRPYLLQAGVMPASALIGRSVQDNGLRGLRQLYLAALTRNGRRIAPVPPQMLLQAGDQLAFCGDENAVAVLQQFEGLQWHGRSQARGQGVLRAVLSPSSQLVGQSLKSADFRRRFDAAVLAVRRGERQLTVALGDLRLCAGDELLLQPGVGFNGSPLAPLSPKAEAVTVPITAPSVNKVAASPSISAFDTRSTPSPSAYRSQIESIASAGPVPRDFVIVSDTPLAAGLGPGRSRWVMAGFLTVIGLGVAGWLPLINGLILLLLLLLATRVISPTELQRRFPLELAVIIASALNLAGLMLSSGLAGTLADGLLGLLSDHSPLAVLITVYLLTLLLTELMTNNAAAALAFPIAYAAALHLSVDSRPFILAVVFGASASFISPYGYQTNLMVQQVGGYQLRDYLQLGLPVSLLYSALVLWLIPLFFPF